MGTALQPTITPSKVSTDTLWRVLRHRTHMEVGGLLNGAFAEPVTKDSHALVRLPANGERVHPVCFQRPIRTGMSTMMAPERTMGAQSRSAYKSPAQEHTAKNTHLRPLNHSSMGARNGQVSHHRFTSSESATTAPPNMHILKELV